IFSTSFFMWIATKLIKVRHLTLTRSIYSAFVTSSIIYTASLVFSIIPLIGTSIGFVLGLVLAFFILKKIYVLDWGNAVIVWIFSVLAQF
ncbi:hypothetical protein ACFLRX_01400, partial [Acidobacteriota bacterium]